jgi:hypothetical protein
VKSSLPFIGAFALLLSQAHAVLIYESAVAGPYNAGGFGYDDVVYMGSHFTLTSPASITAVGGHFMYTVGTSFAAIIAAPANSVPAFEVEDLAANALAHAVFSTPSGNIFSDVTIPLSVSLPAGEYALVFGSGLFGATGEGALSQLNPPWYLDHWFESLYTITSQGVIIDRFWSDDLGDDARSQGVRFFVEGDGPAFVPPRDSPHIPEPAGVILGMASIPLMISRRRR